MAEVPLALSSFVGRQRDLTKLHELLKSSRLLTLTGRGGVGKTRLALAVTRHVAVDYADGVRLVELAGVSPRISTICSR